MTTLTLPQERLGLRKYFQPVDANGVQAPKVSFSPAFLQNPSAWYSESFLPAEIGSSLGRAPAVVSAFDEALESRQSPSEVQSRFLTACTVISQNHSLLSNHLPDKELLSDVKSMLVDLMEETSQITRHLRRSVERALVLEEYNKMMASASTRLMVIESCMHDLGKTYQSRSGVEAAHHPVVPSI